MIDYLYFLELSIYLGICELDVRKGARLYLDFRSVTIENDILKYHFLHRTQVKDITHP